MSKKVAIIGDGGWGTALGLILNENGADVTIWGPFPDYLDSVRKAGENTLYLPGIPIPKGISWTADRHEAVSQTDAFVLAVPTQYFSSTVGSFAGLIPSHRPVVSVAKGLDHNTHKRMSVLAADLLHTKNTCALSGPSHAEEVARGIPTAVVLAAEHPSARRDFQQLFSNNHFRVYTSNDTVGVELGGALKNIIAVAVGVSDGLGFGDNTRAALITRGLAEITRLGCALGAERSTFSGLSGMGDLIVTCTSPHSRNRAVGERLGKGETMEKILSGMKQVAEGVWNCAIVNAIAEEERVEAPITQEIHAILNNGKDPRDAVTSLLARDLKEED